MAGQKGALVQQGTGGAPKKEDEWKPIIFKPELGSVASSYFEPEEEPKGKHKRNFVAPAGPPEKSRHIFMVVLLIIVTSLVAGYMFSGIVMNKILPVIVKAINQQIDQLMPTIAKMRALF